MDVANGTQTCSDSSRVLFFPPSTSLSWWSSSFWPLILPCDGSPLQDAPLSRMCHLSRTVTAHEVRGPWRPRARPRAVATRAYRAAWWRPDRIILVLEQKLGRENRWVPRLLSVLSSPPGSLSLMASDSWRGQQWEGRRASFRNSLGSGRP